MSPALIAMIPAAVETMANVYLKIKEQLDSGKEVTHEEVAALFAKYPIKSYDEYLNEARAAATRAQPDPL